MLQKRRTLSVAIFSTLFIFACGVFPFQPPAATVAASQAVKPAFPEGTGGCTAFPGDNIWNTPIDRLPVDPASTDYINSIGANTGLHPDFGANWNGGPFGIPYNLVPGNQAGVSVDFYYPDESDPVLYPIPPNPLIENGSDRHILIVDTGHCVLYELYDASYDGSWHAGSGAVFDLKTNALRPDGWTSADAAGLPILPGLVRYDEVVAGEIHHALRFTAAQTRSSHVWPARHDASGDPSLHLPPMGQRFRLKASVDISSYDPQVQVIFRAMQKYGIILADNGSDWYISGAPDSRWNDDLLVSTFSSLHGSDFEAVNVSSLQVSPDSGETVPPGKPSAWVPVVFKH